MRSVHLDALKSACWADVFDAFGVAGRGYGIPRSLLRHVLTPQVHRIAVMLRQYDEIVEARGLQHGATYALQRLARPVVRLGRTPPAGPLLLVSNHPGLNDSLALFALLPRTDLRVIAARRSVLTALPATTRHLFYVQNVNKANGQMSLARQALRHLRDGGTVLTYPGGRIEPDPAVQPGAAASLDHWSHSIELFARQVPKLNIVPVIVSGVLSHAALAHPLRWLRRKPDDRAWLAATLQILNPAIAVETVTHVTFGDPVRPADLPQNMSARTAVLAEAGRLIETYKH